MTKYDVAASSTSSASKGLRAIRKEPPSANTTAIITLTNDTIPFTAIHPSNNHGRHHPFSPLRRQACRCHTSICQARPAIKLPLHCIESRWQGELSTLVYLAVSIAALPAHCYASSTPQPIDKAKCLTYPHQHSTPLYLHMPIEACSHEI